MMLNSIIMPIETQVKLFQGNTTYATLSLDTADLSNFFLA